MKKNWMFFTLIFAGIYNIVWGSYAALFPQHFFDVLGIPVPLYPEFWQCIGMIVGVYGIGYFIAASNPFKHWPIVLVGLLGKIFGPIGFIQAMLINDFPAKFGLTIITNDLIWWFPFSFILYRALKKRSSETLHLTNHDFSGFEKRKRARFVNSLSGFKSPNLLGTKANDGQTNLCLISSTFHLGADPALLGFILRPDSVARHSLENIRQSKRMTLNHVNSDILIQAHQTSARYERETSEFSACSLTEEYMEYENENENFPAPYVKESHFKLGLQLVREITLEENGTHMIIAKIDHVHLPQNCLRQDGSIDVEKAGSLAVSGLDNYHETTQLMRLAYAKPGHWPKTLE